MHDMAELKRTHKAKWVRKEKREKYRRIARIEQWRLTMTIITN